MEKNPRSTFIKFMKDNNFVLTSDGILKKGLIDCKPMDGKVELKNHSNMKVISLTIPSDLLGIKKLVKLIDFMT